jgi:hypothetical protein
MFSKRNQPLYGNLENFFNDTALFDNFYNELKKISEPVGETKTETGYNEDGSKWYKNTYTTKDGNYTQSVYVSSNYPTNEWPSNYNYPTNWDSLFPTKDWLTKNEWSSFFPTNEWPTYSPKRKTTTPTTNSPVTELKISLNKAINTQNYEEAIRLRDEIRDYEKNNSQINDLTTLLNKAIDSQNYEDAIKYRDKINKLKNK